MKPSLRLTVRRGDAGDVGSIHVGWALREGWNPGLDDAVSFHAADPNGFFIGEIEGRPVACLSLVSSEDAAFAFLGFYIVDPSERGKGYGFALWNAVLARAGGCVGLDGVVAQQSNYNRVGFVRTHDHLRFRGRGETAAARAGVVDLANVPFDAIERLHRAAYPAPRPRFLKRWIGLPRGKALGLVRDGELVAWGVIRPCHAGHKIAPLIALRPEDAETLFAALSSTVPGEEVILDVPNPNAAAVAMAGRHGMEPVFEAARMYKGSPPLLDLDRVYGVTTLEIG